MWAAIVSKLVGTLPETLIGYFETKQKLKQELKLTKIRAKINLAMAISERKTAEQAHVHSWENLYVKMQSNSWKDEVVLTVFLWPFVGVFIPVVQDYVLEGFAYLEDVPYWWVGLTVSICLAIYGIRHRNAARIAAPGLRNKDVESDADRNLSDPAIKL
jgi:VIT1/CCC1 family predicted Fe2+/Mn2+ transporter